MAKKVLNANNAVKKIKAREASLKSEFDALKQAVEAKDKEIADLKAAREEISQKEKQASEIWKSTASQLEKESQNAASLERELLQVKASLKKIEDAYTALEKELKLAKEASTAEQSSKKHELLQSELEKTKTLASQLEELTISSKATESKLNKQIEELKASLLQAEEEVEYAQQRHRKEIDSFQKRLQASEARNEEMALMNQEATKPLIRQVEMIRAQQAQSMQDWEHLEKGQNIKDLEREKIVAVEQNNMLQTKLADLSNKITVLETQLALEREEKTKVVSKLEDADVSSKSRLVQLEAKLEQSNQLLNTKVQELQSKHKVDRLTQLEIQELTAQQERSAESEKNLRVQLASLSEKNSALASRKNSLTDLSPRGDKSNALVIIEKLQRELKQHETQNSALKLQLDVLTQSRELLGEKTERIQELETDIVEMKEVFKTQLDALMNK